MEGSSKKGTTPSTRPAAGITAAVVLSERHQRMPVKYSREDPDSTSSAPILRCCINPCIRAILAPCSCALMGRAAAVIELGAARAAPVVFAPAAAAAPTAAAPAAAAAPA